MKLRCGTSGFSYKEWKGPFYPEKLPDKNMLSYYAEQLGTVEVNNTFYRTPKLSMLEGWAQKVPEEFVFVLKAPRRITHQGKLKGVEDSVQGLWDTAQALGPRLGPFLFQLPPTLRKDVELLDAFLRSLPSGMRTALEFRHESWFDDEVFACLRDTGQALCIADTDNMPSPELVATADWGYLRLRQDAYDDAALNAWSKRIAAQAWKEAFVFFKHEDKGAAPQFALQLRALSAQ